MGKAAARTTRRRRLTRVNHGDGDLFRAQFLTIHAHVRRTYVEGAAVGRQHLVVPAVYLAHESPAATHLHLGGLARPLGQGAQAAQVRRAIAVHPAVFDRQGDLQGERFAGADLGAVHARDEARLGGAGHARGSHDHQPDDR